MTIQEHLQQQLNDNTSYLNAALQRKQVYVTDTIKAAATAKTVEVVQDKRHGALSPALLIDGKKHTVQSAVSLFLVVASELEQINSPQ